MGMQTGMSGTMMSPGGGAVRMNMQNTMVNTAAFQQRTDSAFATFGSTK